MPPVSPMLAKLARELPPAEGMLFEPKWDGFRCIVFRDGAEVELGSRKEKPITRYFPELVDPLRDQLPEKCVLDGEIVIAGTAGLDFDALLQRIHPADSRVRLLAEQTPASFVAFDLLAVGDEDLRPAPQGERRQRLEAVLAGARPPVHLTPVTTDRDVAAEWFAAFEGAGLDGVVAKPVGLPYRENERVMFKVKHERTADCVVAGFRWHKSATGHRFDAARSLRRRRRSASHRRHVRLSHGPAQDAGRRARPLPGQRPGRPPLGAPGPKRATRAPGCPEARAGGTRAGT